MSIRAALFHSILFASPLLAQPAIEWQRCLGGTAEDEINAIQQTSDGGYIAVGSTMSDDGDVTGNHGISDLWVVKLDSAGGIEWQRNLGGSGFDRGDAVRQTVDGGFVVLGMTGSSNGDVIGQHGDADAWVVKLDASGALQWQKCLGGTELDFGLSIEQAADQGFLVYAETGSIDGDVTGYNGGVWDNWVVKLDALGDIQWQKCLGGSGSDYAGEVTLAGDGGYTLAGYTYSNDSTVSGNHGDADTWVVRLDSAGSLLWQRCVGGSLTEAGRAIAGSDPTGYLVASTTNSSDGDAVGCHGAQDYLLTLLDSTGGVQWSKCLGGSDTELVYSVCFSAAGEVVVTGCTHSIDGDVSGLHATEDLWLVNLDMNGTIQWQKCLGGDLWEAGNSVVGTADGGFVVAGYTGSNNGDVLGNHGDYDGWVVKLAPANAAIQEGTSLLFDHFPDPADTEVRIVTRGTSSFVALSLHDLGGRVLQRMPLHGSTHTLDVSDLAPGMYVITLHNAEGRNSRRLVVE